MEALGRKRSQTAHAYVISPKMPFSETEQETISPHTGEPIVGTHRAYPSIQELDYFVKNADKAQKLWRDVALKERIAIGRKFVVSLPIFCVDKDMYK